MESVYVEFGFCRAEWVSIVSLTPVSESSELSSFGNRGGIQEIFSKFCLVSERSSKVKKSVRNKRVLSWTKCDSTSI